jgi:FlaA1/EpsC-like NDP-sugar epimerase
MTISEAVSLVLQAFASGRNGDILVLDLGEPVRVADLAKTLFASPENPARNSSSSASVPAKKLCEELFYPDERVPAERL